MLPAFSSQIASSLAIVIPYYKRDFLEQLLNSLSSQTDLDFNVYIGDDCSPQDPTVIIDSFRNRLNIRYHRYDSRVGGRCLASHWNRCLTLLSGEEWIWVLPDDDLPGQNCVKLFRSSLVTCGPDSPDVWVMPLGCIDGNGLLIEAPRYRGFGIETNYRFYFRQLQGEAQGSSLGENIFNASSLLATGGFVPFPKGWGSDHATLLLVSANRGIGWIHDADFFFRRSSVNISGQTSDGAIKMLAKLMFAKWLRAHPSIFAVTPSSEFWRCIYYKGEHYFLYEWTFSWLMFWYLLRVRMICIPSGGHWRVILLLVKKLLGVARAFSS